MATSLQDFQRNAAFVVVVIIGGFALFVYLAHTLVDVLVPLIWAAFFAVPLTGLIGKIDKCITDSSGCFRWCCSGRSTKTVHFTAKTRENHIILDGDDAKNAKAAEVLKQHLQHPCDHLCEWMPFSRCCQSRIKIVKLKYADCQAEDCQDEVACWDISQQAEVNRLVNNWRYYALKDEEDDMKLYLYIDQDHEIKAVIEHFHESDAEGGIEVKKDLTGSIELDRSSASSWFVAVMVCMVFLALIVFAFVRATALGIEALERTAPSYGKGVVEFMKWGDTHLERVLPYDMITTLNNSTLTFAKTGLPAMATAAAADLEKVGFQVMMFMIYILFWVFEPIPMNSNVAQLIKNYLMLKTIVCLVFAVLMSGLLYFLSCPLWHIFFVIAFLMNYVPELGFMIVFLLAIPAVALDSNLTMTQREGNTIMLLGCGMLIKVLTANVLEVRMYTSLGGQFMHMHPVVLLALIVFFDKILGVTGMFLAIPMAAMVKYFVHTADIPGCYLHAALMLFEGDEHAGHKHFVKKHERRKEMEEKESERQRLVDEEEALETHMVKDYGSVWKRAASI